MPQIRRAFLKRGAKSPAGGRFAMAANRHGGFAVFGVWVKNWRSLTRNQDFHIVKCETEHHKDNVTGKREKIHIMALYGIKFIRKLYLYSSYKSDNIINKYLSF
ncbi:MAG: hypothetical protein LBV27_06060 [Oscillospiraceae bacterium]|nr:hypothetical protein [Oscillospiraceae bacterium]